MVPIWWNYRAASSCSRHFLPEAIWKWVSDSISVILYQSCVSCTQLSWAVHFAVDEHANWSVTSGIWPSSKKTCHAWQDYIESSCMKSLKRSLWHHGKEEITNKIDRHQVKSDAGGVCKRGIDDRNFGVALAEMSQYRPVSLSFQSYFNGFACHAVPFANGFVL